MKITRPNDFYIYFLEHSDWWCWLNYKTVTGFISMKENPITREDERYAQLTFKLYIL